MEKLERINQINDEINRYELLIEEQYNLEQAVKLVLNSIYGSFGSVYFSFFNTDIAEAITQQAKEINQYAEKVINHYFANMWINDTELHNKLGIKVINQNIVTSSLSTIYMDTDSIFSLSTIYSSMGKMYIEDLFLILKKNIPLSKDTRGNEVLDVNSNVSVLNYNEKLNYIPIKYLIRHKVSKEKWKLKTKSGKEIIITGDHSLIVFRDGKKIAITAKEINIKTDKILTIKEK